VLAAPAVREIHEPRDDVIVRVLARDVEGVSEKPGNTLGEKLAYENRVDEWDHTTLNEDESAPVLTLTPPSESPQPEEDIDRAEDNDPR
jgi:hypothetical protein